MLKVDTDVLLSAYSGWVMTNKGMNEISKVFKYLEGKEDIDINSMLLKWRDYIDEQFNVRYYFECYVMPQEMNEILSVAYEELGEFVYLLS